jgi:hypothetical protein
MELEINMLHAVNILIFFKILAVGTILRRPKIRLAAANA